MLEKIQNKSFWRDSNNLRWQTTRILKRDLVWTVLAATRYTVIRYGQCWSLFGTQSLGMDSAVRYSVHSH
jgi:hypothetical protein